jgi:secreted PhoX family phosphatase
MVRGLTSTLPIRAPIQPGGLLMMRNVSTRSLLALVATGLGCLAPLTSCSATAVDAASDDGDGELGSVQQAFGSLPGFVTSIKPYAVAVTPEYAFQPLLSVGDRVPRSSNPAQGFQFVGIPDGMGSYRGHGGSTILYLNHEFGNTVTSEPVVGGPLLRGAFVSRYVLDSQGRVTQGDLGYTSVWDENTLVGPIADVTNTTPAFARFCSGSLAYREAGFDRPIYFAGEEAGGAGTFDGLGGLGVAIFDNELHTLPKFGRFPWENTLAQPKRGSATVLLGMEDGPASPDNQLYLYVGTKERTRGATPMRRNGLDNGKLYAFVSDTAGIDTELTFTAGSIDGHFVEIPNAEALSDVELEAAADSIGAFGFIRTEDAAFDPKNPDVVYFVTTGSGAGNQLGRLYKMTLDSDDPTGHAVIEMLYNADALAAAGTDIAVSPDNVGISDDFLMINEDGTAPSRLRMEALGREASIWRLDIRNGNVAKRIAELNPTARDAVDIPVSGTWESTGIIPAPGLGKDTWFVNVQAHSPSTAPAANTVEDGQLLLMRRTNISTLVGD